MARARKEVELAVRIGHHPGALADVLTTIAQAHVNVLAYCSYSDRHESVLLLITDQPLAAKTALEAAGFSCKANPVVLVSEMDRIGAAAELGAHLGNAGISILYSYASSSPGAEFVAVFKTMDDESALRVLDPTRQAEAA